MIACLLVAFYYCQASPGYYSGAYAQSSGYAVAQTQAQVYGPPYYPPAPQYYPQPQAYYPPPQAYYPQPVVVPLPIPWIWYNGGWGFWHGGHWRNNGWAGHWHR